MSVVLHPKKETTLLLFLKEELTQWRPRTIKDRLRRQCIQVNGEVVTHHLFAIGENDTVEIHKAPVSLARPKGGIEVLYQDTELVGICKPKGLLSVGTDRERHRHALAMVRQALGQHQRLWPVHRLDRATSGVMLFARSREVCEAIQARWDAVEKVYVAVVEGHLSPPDGVVDQALHEDNSLSVRVSDHPDSKDSRTHYWTRRRSERRSLLEIRLETGRRHQIRAHMAFLGHPIVGDPRYGEKASRMALHARELTFDHPLTGKTIVLRAEPPPGFEKLLSGGRGSKCRNS